MHLASIVSALVAAWDLDSPGCPVAGGGRCGVPTWPSVGLLYILHLSSPVLSTPYGVQTKERDRMRVVP